MKSIFLAICVSEMGMGVLSFEFYIVMIADGYQDFNGPLILIKI